MVEHFIGPVRAELFVKQYEDGERRLVGGVEKIWVPCWKCGGTRRFPSTLDNAWCWGCRVADGSTGGKWLTRAELAQRDHERELRAARRDRKAAERAAELPRKIEALVQAYPLLAELTYLDDYAGILGSMRLALESYGELSAKQVAFAEKLIREGMDRAAQAERVAVERAAEAAGRVNAHFGEVGERFTKSCPVTGKVRVQHEMDGDYGMRTLLVIDTPRGTVKWTASRLFGELRGTEVTLTGTVKKHEIRDGEAQTVLTRCSLLD